MALVSRRKMTIGFVHPDLGIGGAERLVVDAAVALQQSGHHVIMYTSHCDPGHSFAETQNGTLRVVVWGDWIPRHLLGKFHVVFAILRMLWVTLRLLLGCYRHHVLFVDQVSYTVPLLRLTGARVLFYVHFPDKLLARPGSLLKAAYRKPLDWLEERTTAAADLLVANSRFTAETTKKHFPSLRCDLAVLYPTTGLTEADVRARAELPAPLRPGFFLSLNRYEEKKNHPLAVRAVKTLLDPAHANFVGASLRDSVHLVVAGGWDERVAENREVYDSLQRLVAELGLTQHVTLLRSVPGPLKAALLHHCACVVYTPRDEHFGIVPVEAMQLGRPVVAVNSGGPKETIADEVTGWLCADNPSSFGAPLKRLILERDLGKRMGEAGMRRVEERFGFAAFRTQLNAMVQGMK